MRAITASRPAFPSTGLGARLPTSIILIGPAIWGAAMMYLAVHLLC